MLKLTLCLIGLTGLAVAYDFKDSYYNELLLEELLGDTELSRPLDRFRRSVTESSDDKCKRRLKCCNDANVENLEKIVEIKKQCFSEVRNKNKVEKSYDPVDLFSCERLNKTKMEVICAMECLARKKEIIDEQGELLEGKLPEFVKANFAADEWQEPVSAEYIESCLKEVKEKAAKNPRAEGECNPAASHFGYCMWRKITLGCPKEKQETNKRCERIREKLNNNEPLHIYKSEIDDI